MKDEVLQLMKKALEREARNIAAEIKKATTEAELLSISNRVKILDLTFESMKAQSAI